MRFQRISTYFAPVESHGACKGRKTWVMTPTGSQLQRAELALMLQDRPSKWFLETGEQVYAVYAS